jgi:small subunit ribosomal protein S2
MAPYIFTERNGIHIIDLQQTVQMAKDCYNYLRDFVKDSKKILFIGTKKQARSSIEKEANRCNMPYISNRWLGGLLTNFETVKKSIERMKLLEELEQSDKLGTIAKTKKEKLMLKHELEKLKKNLIGIKDMNKIPDGIIVIDPKREHIAVAEARKLGLKIFAVIDTNCNPDVIDYAIPGNDDAIRAISLFLNIMAEAIIEGTGQEFSEDGLSIVEDPSEEPPATADVTDDASPDVEKETKSGEGALESDAREEKTSQTEQKQAEKVEQSSSGTTEGDTDSSPRDNTSTKESEKSSSDNQSSGTETSGKDKETASEVDKGSDTESKSDTSEDK